MKYKYKLDPSSKKFDCPKCEKKRFVRLINELGEYLSAEFGRCDRSNSCGYSQFPQSIEKELQIDYSLPSIKVSAITSKIASTIDISIVNQSMKRYETNPFFEYLRGFFYIEEIDFIFNLYKVGTSKKWGGSTVFWQINLDFEVRSGKIIKYDKDTGKRIKLPFPLTTWVHSLLQLKEFNLKQVLFGEHLLSQFPEKVICIVESEKTAIIMALKHPAYLWLATSGKEGFTCEKLRVLKNRRIVVFPDSDAFDHWSQKTELIIKQINLKIFISPFIMNCTIALEQTQGFDLADLIQMELNKSNSNQMVSLNKNSVLEHLKHQNPCLSELIAVFELEVVKK
jgi:hypothetical protein